MQAAGVSGPLLVSVGRADQLAKFLELNPELAGLPAAVDDTPEFKAYRAAGLGLLGDVKLEEPPDFKPPRTMGPGSISRCGSNLGRRASPLLDGAESASQFTPRPYLA